MATKINNHIARELWLQAAVTKLRPRYAAHGKLPATIHAIVSWPRGSKTAIGQFFGTTWVTNKKDTYIAVSPAVKEPVEVLAILVHELIHALGINGHGADFKKPAQALGLEGKMRATVAGADLIKDLTQVAKLLGPYPHVAMHDAKAPKKKAKTKNSIRCVSPADEKYACWLSPKQFEAHGAPKCPISGKPMIAQLEDEEKGEEGGEDGE